MMPAAAKIGGYASWKIEKPIASA
ncbi:hypothetical protein FP2506_18599 [Fulvimarina pelagi HTCC2506]|uniref:Uncharacterized protein n=1 Tax=Fulvimarina pelagi HTCC2506 TaxID=314231 RepID=Q0G0R3_9HYPH|nr:hypothetical protein FP2506_18599 [Fulvimarina pelagi HTCC2506]